MRDEEYQRALVGINPEATSEYSLHTTGYSFDILRKYRNDRQAEAFQFMLDRLRALAVIDYAVEPTAIHITVSDGRSALRGSAGRIPTPRVPSRWGPSRGSGREAEHPSELSTCA